MQFTHGPPDTPTVRSATTVYAYHPVSVREGLADSLKEFLRHPRARPREDENRDHRSPTPSAVDLDDTPFSLALSPWWDDQHRKEGSHRLASNSAAGTGRTRSLPQHSQRRHILWCFPAAAWTWESTVRVVMYARAVAHDTVTSPRACTAR